MACIKGVNRSASVALAPDGGYIASGTMAGAVDLSFSSSATLEIFKLDFQSDHPDLPLVAESPSSERFNRLSWGRNGSGSEEFSLGLIAGGLVDGTIDLWNPLKLIRFEGGEKDIVGHLSRHKGPVRGLEFNIIAPNLLASGADEGEICIWDLATPTEPSHFPPLKVEGSGSAAQGEISFLSWNSKVQHILASTSYNGTTVVWDLKKQKPVISFSDSIRRRCSVLQWNPDVATQLVVASDEDNSPSIRLWDMRNIMSPVKEFVGHSKGVIAMSWCPTDSSYLITCAKDNRTICWDTISGEIISELPSGSNWNFDVHWYPKIPGIISASSFDGRISIYNVEGCGRYGVRENEFDAAPLRAPKWLKRPVGTSFGFGGKLVSFRPRSGGTSHVSSEVYVHNVVSKQSSERQLSEFDTIMQSGDKTTLRSFCDKKSLETSSADDQETWKFLKVLLEEDGTARSNLLAHLGFELPVETNNMQEDINQQVNGLGLDDMMTAKVSYEEDKGPGMSLTDNGEDFFNNLPSPRADTPLSTAAAGDELAPENVVPLVEEESDLSKDSSDPLFGDSILRALVVGDYKGAVALCISANKMADALVIAHVGGPSLWESTRDKYLKNSRSPYLKVISAMVTNDLHSLVDSRSLKYWKETLAMVCSFAQGEEWTLLCNTLASKLLTAGNTLAATLCFICAGNIDKTVEIWSMNLAYDHEGKSYIDLLQDLMEKTIVLALASGQKQFSASVCKLVEKYAEILAGQGLLKTAMEYLNLLGTDNLTPELAILKDRIAYSMEAAKEPEVSPFDSANVQNGSIYNPDQTSYASVNAQHYHQEAIPSQVQQSVPGSPYEDHSLAKQYPAPPYAVTPQPSIFVPSPAPQIPQTSFAPPLVPNQPPMTTFMPAPPMQRSFEQFQPSTLGSQLYPGTTNPPFQSATPRPGSLGQFASQTGPIPGPKMLQSLPQPPLRGFTPVSNPGAVPMPVMQPPSPRQPAPVQPVATPATPPTVQTADTSNVPVHQKNAIVTLTRLFNESSEVLGGSRANPAKKREIEDNSRKIGALFAKLNSGDISKNAADKLVQLCQALDRSDFGTALQIQVQLTTSEWDECNFWLATLKRMIKTRQNVR